MRVVSIFVKPLGKQGVYVHDNFSELQKSRYLNYLIQTIQKVCSEDAIYQIMNIMDTHIDNINAESVYRIGDPSTQKEDI